MAAATDEPNKVYYVYVDYRLDTGAPFYVGKGLLARVRHVTRNVHHTRIVAKYGFRRDVVFATKLHDAAVAEEVRLIVELKTRDHQGGTNMTDGGDGTPGWVPSEDTRMKIGIANTGKPVSGVERVRRSRAAAGEHNPNYGNRPAPRVECKCEWCGRSTERRESKASPFCSTACFYSHLAEMQTGPKNSNYREKIAVQCAVCPTTYYVTQNTAIKGYKKTCSRTCRFKLLSLRTKEHHAKKRRA